MNMNNETNMKLDSNIKKFCKLRGMNISQLAKKSGVSQPTLHGWANGRNVQNLDDLKKVAEVLEISVHLLLYGTPDPFEVPAEEILKEIFSGDIRVTLHKIEKVKK